MTVFDTFLTYFGAVILVLTFLYGIKEYLVTLFAGFLAFCVYHFAFATPDFEWTYASMLPILKDAGIIYGISYIIGLIIYKSLPAKQFSKTSV